MMGRKDRRQPELFVAGSLKDLVPDDHILVRVDRILDLNWSEGEVADCYSVKTGRPGIAPKVAVRLMLAGLLLGIVHDRHLLREAQVNLAIRWFIGYGLHETVPDHSSLTRILGSAGVPSGFSGFSCGRSRPAWRPRSRPVASFTSTVR